MDQHHSGITQHFSSYNSLNNNMKQLEGRNDEGSYPVQQASAQNDNLKTYDHDVLNNIANMSSITSELHKQYEMDNLNDYRKQLQNNNDCYYDNDNKYVDQLRNNLLVNNHDHQFLYPWIDLIMPNYSKPYCTNLKIKTNKNESDQKQYLKYSIMKHDNLDQQMLYLTENQMYLIIESVLDQIVSTTKDVPVTIDWAKVSRESRLSQDVCKAFFWSFDKTHIKDRFGGCLFPANCKHYYKVEESYFSELKNRVQYLIQLARECKDERQRILNNHYNHV